MERYEQPAFVGRPELRAGVELQRHRRPVPRERDHRGLRLVAAPDLLPVAAVLGGEHLLLLRVAVVAVGPPEVVALVHLHQLLRRVVRVRLVAETPVVAELVASVDRGPDLARPGLHRERLGVPHPRRPS